MPFQIPTKKKRLSISILEVLAKTIDIDVTAPHFSLIDDPATIPTSINRKKHYYLCKEFGKRAARQLAAEWPTLFMLNQDKPQLSVFRIEKFLDPLIVDPNEKNLVKIINSKNVEDAVKLYEKLQQLNINVSNETQISLFRLICYYNCKNPPITEILEWHGIRNFTDGNVENNKESTLIKKLFETLPKTAKNYSTLICNFCKFPTTNSLLQAKIFFKEMIDKNYKPSEEVFNFFILNQLSLNNSEKYDVFEELKYMAKIGVLPSIKTFNAALNTLFQLSDVNKRYKMAKGLISEIEACNLQFNLTTFKILLALFNQKISSKNWIFSAKILNAIVFYLENIEKIEVSQTTDENFFVCAIELAINIQSSNLVERLNKLYNSKKNFVQFSSFITETKFFSQYLFFKAHTMPIKEFESVYVAHIPRVASLSSNLAFLIFKKLKQTPLWSFTKRVIEDGVTVGYISNKEMSKEWQELLLNFPLKKLNSVEIEEYTNLLNLLINAWKDVKIANDFLQNLPTKSTDKLQNHKIISKKESKDLQNYKNRFQSIDFEHFQDKLIEKKILQKYL